MTKLGNGKGSFTEFLILNAIFHFLSIFLSYPLYFTSNVSLSSFQKEIYQILGTIFWLFLFQIFKFHQLQRILHKISSNTFSIWLNLSLWIRIIILFSVLVAMIWNDYFRIAICSCLSAISINQYQKSQHAIHYSSQSVITTTGYSEEFLEQNKILPFNAPPTAVSVDMKRSSDFSSLRHRRGSSRTSHSILPTHVAQPNPSFQRKVQNADRFNQQAVCFFCLSCFSYFQ
jgi:hypothetical protein